MTAEIIHEPLREEEKQKFWELWFRARHNAMANLIAAKRAERWSFWIDVVTAVCVVIPIGTVYAQAAKIGDGWYLPIFSLIFSLFALLLTLLAPAQNFKRQINTFYTARSFYTNIAQKARRADGPYIKYEERVYLLRTLEEMFEMAKFNNAEPSGVDFDKANERIKKMPKLPFDGSIDD